MDNKKGLIKVIVVIAIIVLAGTLFFFFKDISAKNELTKEINALSETNINTDIKTSGKFAIVEKLVKEDYKTYFESTNKLRENYNKVAELKVLNIENYKNDGPDFNSSLGVLNTTKEENIAAITTLSDLVDENKIEEKSSSNGIDGKYKKLYKDILEQIKLPEGVNKIKETDTKYSNYLNALIDVLTYMKDNKAEWFVENDTLKSKSQAFIDKYNQMVEAANIEL